MKLLVCGHGGLLARDVILAAAEAGIDAVGLGRKDLDVTEPGSVERGFERERPDVVINCAAWADVEGAEDAEAAAMAANAAGAGNVAAAAASVGASVVYPSTDYVFDGAKREPYVESDEPRPLSAYGRTKLAGEHETAAANDRHFIVRSSWLYGLGGRNFVEVVLGRAAERAPMRVVDDQVGSPTYAAHLARAIIDLASTSTYGIHHIAGGGMWSWYEFAVEIVRRAGVELEISPCTSEEFPTKATRPSFSALASERAETPRLPAIEVGLEAYLAEREAER